MDNTNYYKHAMSHLDVWLVAAGCCFSSSFALICLKQGAPKFDRVSSFYQNKCNLEHPVLLDKAKWTCWLFMRWDFSDEWIIQYHYNTALGQYYPNAKCWQLFHIQSYLISMALTQWWNEYRIQWDYVCFDMLWQDHYFGLMLNWSGCRNL